MISVVLPIHNERDNLAPLLAEITTALEARSHEIVAVDDASTDGSLETLLGLRRKYPTLRVIALAYRSGQSGALMAGCDVASGDVVATVDADGQNDPAEIPHLLEQLSSDPQWSAAVGFRVRRADSRWKRIQSRIANAVRNWITNDTVRDTGCGLKAFRKAALLRLPRFDGMHRFLPTLIRLEGGQVIEVPVTHRPRRHGSSKYGMWDRGLRGLSDALVIRWFRRRALRYDVRSDVE